METKVDRTLVELCPAYYRFACRGLLLTNISKSWHSNDYKSDYLCLKSEVL